MRRLSLFGRFGSPRTRRAAGLLLGLWVLGGIDYLFTIWAQRFTPFQEVNPWASLLLNRHHFASLAASKVLLTGFATVVFWRSRRRTFTQVSLWALVLIHVGLMVQWSTYTADALDMTHATQVQADGRVAVIDHVPPPTLPPTPAEHEKVQEMSSTDQPATSASDGPLELASLRPR